MGIITDFALNHAKSRKVVLPQEYYGELQGLSRALAFSVSGIALIAVLEFVRDSLAESISKGQSFTDWKQAVVSGKIKLQLSETHKLTVFRTAMAVSYNRGRCAEQRKTRFDFPYLEYSAINDSKTRDEHRRMDGFIAAYDDPIWFLWRPPNGFNCRCILIKRTKRQYEALIKADPSLTQKPIGILPDAGFAYDPCGDIYGVFDGLLNQSKKGFFDRIVDKIKSGFDKLKSLLQ